MDPGKYNKIAFILAVILVVTGGFFIFQKNALAATGINEQINFQGKLVNTDGTNITDGTYNMEFKIYQDGDGVPGGGDETLKWTEDRLRNNSQGVVVTDGIFQVNLGSVTAFSGIDWNQSVLWVSINVGNTNASCTPFSNCSPDGEMDPMIRFTAAPYALNADKVSGLTVTDTTGTLTIPNTKTVQFADAFTTSGAFATTLTVTNTTNATLPAGTVTLAALGTAQTWTANQTFANSTATDDTLGFNITTGGAARFAGMLTNADLTGDHSWILPNLDGTVALTANNLSVFAATTSAQLYGVISDETGSASGSPLLVFNVNPTLSGLTMADNTNIALNATTGTKIGTATSQKLAFYNSAPIIQPSGNALTALSNLGLVASPTLTSTDVGLGNVTNNAQLITGNSTQNGYFHNLYLDDTDASNHLIVDYGSDVASDFTLGILMTASRNLTIAGDASISGTNTGDQYIFKTIDAPSGTDPEADTTSDTLQLLAGANITITGDSGADSITIAASGGSGYSLIQEEGGDLTARSTLNFIGSSITCADNAGKTECTITGGSSLWTDGGAITYLTATGDNVAIGDSASSAPFYMDVATNTLRIGDADTTNNGILAMYGKDGDMGTITYNDNDVWAFEGGRVAIGASAISNTASTERMLQVGSETNRGNLATYGEVISKGLNRHTALTGIKDIFVYDTTGDSDGGRWIDWATTDNLSWYSETLDDGPNDPCNIATDDRCYNSAFPRKAILVVTTDALYIFDAATNDLWMKFSQNDSGYALGANTNNDPSSVTALNGVIYVGTNGSSSAGVNGLYAIDFVNDRIWNYNGTTRAAANVGISGRNSAVSYNVDPDAKLEISPVGTAAEWERVNDVHVVVMSRTQSAVTALGAATNTNPGYGKVFIALATDSGITVINPSGRVLNQYSDVASDDYTAVALSTRGFLYALNATSDQLERWDTIDTDKASEVPGTYNRKWDETIGTGPALASAAFQIIAGAPDNLEIAERASNNLNTEDVIYVGHSLGMAELHEHTTQAFGWVKYYNSTRQTPMMMLAGINDMVLPMDDTSGTQAQDVAIANTDMAIIGTPTLGVNGVQGKAINFDNTDDYLCSDANQDNTCDVDTAFNMSTVGWTISLWFRHSATAPASGADTIFEKCVTATPGKATGCVIAYMTTTGTIVVANDDDATYTRPDEGAASYDITATSTYAYNDNQWHNLIITRTNVNDVDSWIDGQGMTLSTATGLTITFDGSQIVTLGASCSFAAGANCTTTTNHWDGQLDDVQFIVGTTTQATMTQLYVRRYFNVERPRASKKTISVTDATSATSTSLTDTGEAWDVNELAGLIVEITGSDDMDCVGITRRISSNTATSLTFTPAVPGSCTLDTSADFQVDPEALYGESSSISGIGITAETPLGEARQLCVGTNDTADGGGVTCYNHQDGPSIVADVYHSQASQTDDSGTDWSGTDYDDMRAIDLSTRTLIMASEGHFTSITEDVRLGQGLDYISNQLYAIRQEIVLDAITAIGSTGSEVGFTGGADLAEYYTSEDSLIPGDIVSVSEKSSSAVAKSASAYQKDLLGVVATAPGMILGTQEENSYPVTLVGRVPVNVSTENGLIKAGDQITSGSLPGYGMLATEAGRVIGTALEDLAPENIGVCPGDENLNPAPEKKCGQVTAFINLSDYLGIPISELAQNYYDKVEQENKLNDLVNAVKENEEALVQSEKQGQAFSGFKKEEKILEYLEEIKREQEKSGLNSNSEIFAGKLIAKEKIISPEIFAENIFAKSIKADKIEGLEFIQTGLNNAQSATDENSQNLRNLGGELDALQKKISEMAASQSSDDQEKSLSVNSLKGLITDGVLAIEEEVEFRNQTVFQKVAQFFGKVIFGEDVEFAGRAIFNNDTAGYAVIKEGEDKVGINFNKEYDEAPVVNATLSIEKIEDKDLRKATEEFILLSDLKYVITNVSGKGFEIKLNQKTSLDMYFNWQAVAVKDPRTFGEKSEDKSQKETDKTVISPPAEEPINNQETTNIQNNNTPVDNTVSQSQPAVSAATDANISQGIIP